MENQKSVWVTGILKMRAFILKSYIMFQWETDFFPYTDSLYLVFISNMVYGFIDILFILLLLCRGHTGGTQVLFLAPHLGITPGRLGWPYGEPGIEIEFAASKVKTLLTGLLLCPTLFYSFIHIKIYSFFCYTMIRFLHSFQDFLW